MNLQDIRGKCAISHKVHVDWLWINQNWWMFVKSTGWVAGVDWMDVSKHEWMKRKGEMIVFACDSKCIHIQLLRQDRAAGKLKDLGLGLWSWQTVVPPTFMLGAVGLVINQSRICQESVVNKKRVWNTKTRLNMQLRPAPSEPRWITTTDCNS